MMNRILLIFCVLCASVSLSAQSGFGIAPVFNGKLVPSSRINETYIDGSQLAPYKLRVFRSVKFTATADEYRQVMTLLLQDAEGAEDKQTEYKEGDLVYALFRFRAQVRSTRNERQTEGSKYLCMQAARSGDGYALTLVYMAGDATLADLKQLFKKQ